MSKFPDEDQKLVDFLRKYQPTAPASQQDGETQLVNLIAQNPRRDSQGKYRRVVWLVPAILVAVGLVFWLGKPRVVPSLSIASENSDLEKFMINSWDHSLGNNPESTVEYTAFDEIISSPSNTEQSLSQP